eukprot:COSAG01_NODE_2758_length_7121_cov_64.907434_3_plen_173_part_00
MRVVPIARQSSLWCLDNSYRGAIACRWRRCRSACVVASQAPAPNRSRCVEVVVDRESEPKYFYMRARTHAPRAVRIFSESRSTQSDRAFGKVTVITKTRAVPDAPAMSMQLPDLLGSSVGGCAPLFSLNSSLEGRAPAGRLALRCGTIARRHTRSDPGADTHGVRHLPWLYP